ncbi:MAG: GNAT family N-acetyltransferase [Gemmatimonadales bacterium]|nr:GNAT family N-acetyltransferase [Gemmatimonadales bacterium]MDQ3428074.1 GNAT family N-acetyltransferase [Gemmatimonadota bacterium]
MRHQLMARVRAAGIEERLLLPAYASRWSGAAVAVHRILSLPLQVAGPVRRLRVPCDGGPLSVITRGRDKLIEPLRSRLLGPAAATEPEESRGLWNYKAPARSGADLILAEVHRWLAPQYRKAGWLIVPDAVRWKGAMKRLPPAEPSGSLLDDLRKVRQGRYTMEHTTEQRDWDEFFATMVEPNAQARFGQQAWTPSRALSDGLARVGVLHLVLRDGARVAGACSVRHGDTLWLPLTGISRGDPILLRQGAGVAAVSLTFEWARAQGCRVVDLGRTSPFLRDGIQQYKRKWGFEPVPDPLSHLVAVWIGSEAARQAFARQPVLVETGVGLEVYAGASP